MHGSCKSYFLVICYCIITFAVQLYGNIFFQIMF